MSNNNTFSFSAEPRPVGSRGTKQKPRDGAQSTSKPTIIENKVQIQRVSQQNTIKKAPQSIYDIRPEAKKYIPINLEEHLVERVEVVQKTEVSTQTDRFQPRPSSPVFIPRKTGVDAETQIHNELFDFDIEVMPLLNIIVSKTLEQAQLEVEEEELLARLIETKGVLLQDKQEELQRIVNMEQSIRQRISDKGVRTKAEEDRIQREREVLAKLSAMRVAESLVHTAKQAAMKGLDGAGFFPDPVAQQIEAEFCPWLYQKAEAQTASCKDASRVLDDILLNALEKLQVLRQTPTSYVRLNLSGQGIPDDMVGPIPIYPYDNQEDVERRIQTWLSANVKNEIATPEGGFLRLVRESDPSFVL